MSTPADHDRLVSTPLEAWFCQNCGNPALGSRCPSCAWELPPLDELEADAVTLLTVDDDTGEFPPLVDDMPDLPPVADAPGGSD